LTLDELLADLDRELARTWGPKAASAAAPEAASAPAAAPGEPAAPTAPAAPAAPAPGGGERCLLMSLAGRRFAVPARSVVAVSELPPVSAVPFSPPWLRGLARAAGGVVAVVDLARLVAPGAGPPPGAPAAAADDPAVHETLLVVRASDASLDAGLAVRGIARLVTLTGTPGRPPAAGELAACPTALVAGLVPDPLDAQLAPVAMLDVDRLLRGAHEELCA
jgi:chemotaxis signal transduction protein